MLYSGFLFWGQEILNPLIKYIESLDLHISNQNLDLFSTFKSSFDLFRTQIFLPYSPPPVLGSAGNMIIVNYTYL